MNVSQYFTASLTSPGEAELYAVQGDSGRIVVARLYVGAEPWIVPEGVSGRISYELPDGTEGCYEQLNDGSSACEMSGNQVAVTIAPTLCREEGTVKAVIILNRGEAQISTFPFRLHVVPHPGCPDLDGEMIEEVPLFAGKLFFGNSSGNPVPLAIGERLAVSDGKLIALEDPDQAERSYVDAQIAALRLDMEYEPIQVTGISIAPNIAQLGALVVNPVMRWTLSRMPAAQDIAGEYLDPQQREQVLEESFDGPCRFTLTVTDERGAQATGTVAIAFYNAVYWTSRRNSRGMPADGELHRMSARIQNGRSLTINASAGVGEYVLYAIPSRYGTPKFWCGGLQAAFEKVGTMAHTNEAGYQEDYDVWISEADGLTGVEITVA